MNLYAEKKGEQLKETLSRLKRDIERLNKDLERERQESEKIQQNYASSISQATTNYRELNAAIRARLGNPTKINTPKPTPNDSMDMEKPTERVDSPPSQPFFKTPISPSQTTGLQESSSKLAVLEASYEKKCDELDQLVGEAEQLREYADQLEGYMNYSKEHLTSLYDLIEKATCKNCATPYEWPPWVSENFQGQQNSPKSTPNQGSDKMDIEESVPDSVPQEGVSA